MQSFTNKALWTQLLRTQHSKSMKHHKVTHHPISPGPN